MSGEHQCPKCAEKKYPKDQDQVNHPSHYGGGDNPYECIRVIEAWDLGFHLGTVLKYICRAGKKDSSKTVEDLEKAVWYLNREIGRMKRCTESNPKSS